MYYIKFWRKFTIMIQFKWTLFNLIYDSFLAHVQTLFRTKLWNMDDQKHCWGKGKYCTAFQVYLILQFLIKMFLLLFLFILGYNMNYYHRCMTLSILLDSCLTIPLILLDLGCHLYLLRKLSYVRWGPSRSIRCLTYTILLKQFLQNVVLLLNIKQYIYCTFNRIFRWWEIDCKQVTTFIISLWIFYNLFGILLTAQLHLIRNSIAPSSVLLECLFFFFFFNNMAYSTQRSHTAFYCYLEYAWRHLKIYIYTRNYLRIGKIFILCVLVTLWVCHY